MFKKKIDFIIFQFYLVFNLILNLFILNLNRLVGVVQYNKTL